MGSLIGEVQQRPQLEARVGYRECDFVVDRELLRGDHVDMVVDVEHRPDLIPAAVLVALAPGFFVGEPPLGDRALDDRYRSTSGPERFDVHAWVADVVLKLLEVSGLRLLALADHEDANLG